MKKMLLIIFAVILTQLTAITWDEPIDVFEANYNIVSNNIEISGSMIYRFWVEEKFNCTKLLMRGYNSDTEQFWDINGSVEIASVVSEIEIIDTYSNSEFIFVLWREQEILKIQKFALDGTQLWETPVQSAYVGYSNMLTIQYNDNSLYIAFIDDDVLHIEKRNNLGTLVTVYELPEIQIPLLRTEIKLTVNENNLIIDLKGNTFATIVYNLDSESIYEFEKNYNYDTQVFTFLYQDNYVTLSAFEDGLIYSKISFEDDVTETNIVIGEGNEIFQYDVNSTNIFLTSSNYLFSFDISGNISSELQSYDVPWENALFYVSESNIFVYGMFIPPDYESWLDKLVLNFDGSQSENISMHIPSRYNRLLRNNNLKVLYSSYFGNISLVIDKNNFENDYDNVNFGYNLTDHNVNNYKFDTYGSNTNIILNDGRFRKIILDENGEIIGSQQSSQSSSNMEFCFLDDFIIVSKYWSIYEAPEFFSISIIDPDFAQSSSIEIVDYSSPPKLVQVSEDECLIFYKTGAQWFTILASASGFEEENPFELFDFDEVHSYGNFIGFEIGSEIHIYEFNESEFIPVTTIPDYAANVKIQQKNEFTALSYIEVNSGTATIKVKVFENNVEVTSMEKNNLLSIFYDILLEDKIYIVSNGNNIMGDAQFEISAFDYLSGNTNPLQTSFSYDDDTFVSLEFANNQIIAFTGNNSRINLTKFTSELEFLESVELINADNEFTISAIKIKDYDNDDFALSFIKHSIVNSGLKELSMYRFDLTTLDIEEDICFIQNKEVSLYPNPFNPNTTIEFFNSEDGAQIEISIFNIKGQKVKTIVETNKKKGLCRIKWNGKADNNQSVTSGVYFFNIKIDGEIKACKKSLLLK